MPIVLSIHLFPMLAAREYTGAVGIEYGIVAKNYHDSAEARWL